mmetsp:Transcript_87344/g.154855  ORF Transcript_87344/g.154855 Transcript_87344/m.154855 type:complete len:509 (-) Transcript_87344:135-1661(-)
MLANSDLEPFFQALVHDLELIGFGWSHLRTAFLSNIGYFVWGISATLLYGTNLNISRDLGHPGEHSVTSLALFAASSCGSGMFFLEAFAQDRVLVMSSMSSGICLINISFCSHLWQVMLFQSILGVCAGIAMTFGIIHCSEFTPERHLRQVGLFPSINYAAGFFCTAIMFCALDPSMTAMPWRKSFQAAGIVVLLGALGAASLPMSPRYLIRTGQTEKAVAVLLDFAKGNGKHLGRDDLELHQLSMTRLRRTYRTSPDVSDLSEGKHAGERERERAMKFPKLQNVLTIFACVSNHTAANMYLHCGLDAFEKVMPDVISKILAPANLLLLGGLLQLLGLPLVAKLLAVFPAKVAHQVFANCAGWISLSLGLWISSRYHIAWLFGLCGCSMFISVEVCWTTISQISLQAYPPQKRANALSLHIFVGRLVAMSWFFASALRKADPVNQGKLCFALCAVMMVVNMAIVLPSSVKWTCKANPNLLDDYGMDGALSRSSSYVTMRRQSSFDPAL